MSHPKRHHRDPLKPWTLGPNPEDWKAALGQTRSRVACLHILLEHLKAEPEFQTLSGSARRWIEAIEYELGPILDPKAKPKDPPPDVADALRVLLPKSK